MTKQRVASTLDSMGLHEKLARFDRFIHSQGKETFLQAIKTSKLKKEKKSSIIQCLENGVSLSMFPQNTWEPNGSLRIIFDELIWNLRKVKFDEKDLDKIFHVSSFKGKMPKDNPDALIPNLEAIQRSTIKKRTNNMYYTSHDLFEELSNTNN